MPSAVGRISTCFYPRDACFGEHVDFHALRNCALSWTPTSHSKFLFPQESSTYKTRSDPGDVGQDDASNRQTVIDSY